MISGEGTAHIPGATAQEVFDFVLDPATYTKADIKVVWVTKLADLPDGMIAREDGRFLGRFPGSVITRYRWEPPHHIDVTLVHGIPEQMHAWFEISENGSGAAVRHVETISMPRPFGRLWDLAAQKWFAGSVRQEVAEIGRLMGEGLRGRGPAAHAADLV
jgi:hypothetical protein